MSWVYAVVGLAVGDPETAQAAGFPVLAPLVFASGAFIPVSTMPGWLQAFAAHQPVSCTASAVRALVLGGPASTYVWQSPAWCARQKPEPEDAYQDARGPARALRHRGQGRRGPELRCCVRLARRQPRPIREVRP
jgi:hypothetical protein